MSLETFSSGRYVGTYNALPLGISREGYRFRHETRAQNIEGTDAYGDSTIDMIYRGANMTVSFTLMSAAKTTTSLILCPWTSDLYLLRSDTTPMGRLASALSEQLVLTAEANTPSAANGPATLTAPNCILEPGSVELLFDSRLRDVPITMRVLPYAVQQGGNPTTQIRFATIT